MKLEDVISLERLQFIQDNFAKATGFAAVTVNYIGKPILKYSNFCSFCTKIRQIPKYLEDCIRSDAHISLDTARHGKISIYRCHAGLIDFAVPITINGVYLGSVMCGQIRAIDNIPINNSFFELTPGILEDPELKAEFDKVPFASYQRILACADLLQSILDYIIDSYKLEQENTNLQAITKENLDLDHKLKSLEIKYYSSQLGPHFLFNALNMAGRQAYLEKAEKTQEIIYTIADMYRHNLKESGLLTPLENELANIKNYIFIQKIRFGEQLVFKTNIDKDTLNLQIPAMALQHFVENAMIHGLELKKELGTIDLVVKKNDNRLNITIKDTGVGIDEKILKKINAKNYNGIERKKTTGLGIFNTKKRLDYFFQNDYNLTIQSKIDKCTTVTLNIPII